MSRKPTVTLSSCSGAERSSPRLADMPTVMKNRPSRRPLNGSRSASSSWRNSLSASSTPATKAPSEADSPSQFASSAVAITVSSAAAVNTSLTWARATSLQRRAQYETAAGDDDQHDNEQELRQGEPPGAPGVRPAQLAAQEWQHREHRQHREVLEEQNAEGCPAMLGLQLLALGEHLQHERRGGE